MPSAGEGDFDGFSNAFVVIDHDDVLDLARFHAALVCSAGASYAAQVPARKNLVYQALGNIWERACHALPTRIVSAEMLDRKSTRLNSSHRALSRMPSSA